MVMHYFAWPPSGTWRSMRRYETTEDGVSVLEYVLLVAMVAMVATGTLLYLGRGSGSPSHVANNVGDNVAVGGNGRVPETWVTTWRLAAILYPERW